MKSLMKHKPVFGKRPFGSRDAQLLLIAYFDPNGIETIPEGIAAWQASSRHEIQLFNMWPGRAGQLKLPYDLDLREYEGIVIHPTVSYFPHAVRELDVDLTLRLADYEGVKILMKQDEQVHSGGLAPLVRDFGFDIIFTCLPEPEKEKVYPRSIIGEECLLVRTLTGYVSPVMRNALPSQDKDLDVTYRGSIQPLEFGRLGYEKRGIGYDMISLLTRQDKITFDISSRWEDRISGAVWEDFLRRSNVVLGVESGSNIFDFDGSVVEWCRAYAQRHSGEDPATYRFYRRAHDEFLHTVEGNVNYAQISPRHFEAASAGAAQLLYEGDYSGLFHAERHFFPLRKDLANADAALDFLKDRERQRLMATCAFEEIILDKANWYESFVENADAAIDSKLLQKNLRKATATATAMAGTDGAKPTAYLLYEGDPDNNLRIDLLAESLRQTHDVTIIASAQPTPNDTGYEFGKLRNGVRIVRINGSFHQQDWMPTAGDLRRNAPSTARLLLGLIAQYAAMPTPLLKIKLGGAIARDVEISRFRDICQSMVNSNAAFLNMVERLGRPSLVIGCDFPTLFAAVACGEAYNAPVVYDAQTYWPFSYFDFQHWEIEFWSMLEGRLVALTDLNMAVTPQLAARLENEYGTKFESLPYAVSINSGPSADPEVFQKRLEGGRPLTVVYSGGFTECCGLEDVIQAWAYTKSGARLIMLGADNVCRSRLVDLARSLGLTSEIVSFPGELSADEQGSLLQGAHIGLIALSPGYISNRYTCTPELSIYAANALPILSSLADFSADFVMKNGMGYVYQPAKPKALGELIDQLSESRSSLAAFGQKARSTYEASFNMESLSRAISQKIHDLPNVAPICTPQLERPYAAHRFEIDDNRFTYRHETNVIAAQDLLNILSFDAGAYLVNSSPFHAFPHDPSHLLRIHSDGYAAAIAGASHSNWIEFRLNDARLVDQVAITWLSESERATEFRIMIKASRHSRWLTVVDETAGSGIRRSYRFPPTRCMFIRLETRAYAGQQRMLIRRLELFAVNDGSSST